MEQRRITPIYSKRITAENDPPPKTRVAAYCRVSSEKDAQLHSVKAQIDYFRHFISENPDYTFAGIYADEGISGTEIRKRTEFKRLMEDCRAGLIDTIVVKSVSRFGRNTVDTLKCVRELKAMGVDVYFEKESLHTLRCEGEVLLSLISAVAETESANLSENVRWGLQRKYEDGSFKSVPLGKMLGYEKAGDTITVNEAEAEIVRRIYWEFLEGGSITQIAAGLTADGIPSQQGNAAWSISSIDHILRNEKFKGDTLFQKTYNTNYITKKRAVNTGELPQYYVKNSHPGIVDESIWECVQQEIQRQKEYCEKHHIARYHQHSEKHPLSARIVCATCGCTYIQLTSRRVGTEGETYWRCSSFHGNHGTELEGRTFTPEPMATWTKNPDRYKYCPRKPPVERSMLCTDIQVPVKAPEAAFIAAWNTLVREKAKIRAGGDSALAKYRASELMGLLESTGEIHAFDYALSVRVLDCIEVWPGGKLTVSFLAGIRI